MNIGFFGDSYVDVNDATNSVEKLGIGDHTSKRIWPQILVDSLNAKCVASGRGGSNQYDAIKSWENYISEYSFPPDVAIFTFTWHFRLVHNLHVGHNFDGSEEPDWSQILRSITQGKNTEKYNSERVDELKVGFHLYFKHFYHDEQTLFLHEQLIKWVLDLPNYYPKTKFIFFPNTEISRNLAKKYFDKGVLMDFALGSISELEGEDVNQLPMLSSKEPKWGHLYYENHLKLSTITQEILINYEKFNGKLFTKDYTFFESKQ